MHKRIILPVIAGVIGLIGLGVVTASAASNTPTYRPIVQKIAQRFGLNVADVQAVFDQNKTEQEAAHKTQIRTKLDQAVKDGTISASQEQAILAELDTLQQQRVADRTTFATMTPAQRQVARQQERQAFQTWAQHNNLDLAKLPIGFGLGFGRPDMGGRHGGWLGPKTGSMAQNPATISG